MHNILLNYKKAHLKPHALIERECSNLEADSRLMPHLSKYIINMQLNFQKKNQKHTHDTHKKPYSLIGYSRLKSHLWNDTCKYKESTEFIKHKSEMTGDFCVFFISPSHCRWKTFEAFSEWNLHSLAFNVGHFPPSGSSPSERRLKLVWAL